MVPVVRAVHLRQAQDGGGHGSRPHPLLHEKLVVVVGVGEVGVGPAVRVPGQSERRGFWQGSRVRRPVGHPPESLVLSVHVATAEDDETIGASVGDLHEGLRLGLRVRDHVHDDVRGRCVESFTESIGIVAVAVVDGDGVGERWARFSAVEDSDGVAGVHEASRQVPTNESGTADEENSHGGGQKMRTNPTQRTMEYPISGPVPPNR